MIALAQESLIKAQMTSTLSWLSPGENNWPSCRHASTCYKSRQKIRDSMWLARSALVGLDMWKSEWEDGMCRACITTSKGRYEHGHAQFWRALPVHFRLDDWTALRQMELELVSVLSSGLPVV